MKILDLYIDGFGKFHQKTISFQDGVNVIYGNNEAGKSTVHTFIRGMLFGMERQRGRASKKDLYSKYEPWRDKASYEGRMRVEHNGHIFRIERNFLKDHRELIVVDETTGSEVNPDQAFFNDLLCGLNALTYDNTISIGQLKSATENSMVSELKNYIANMNTSGSRSINITKATDRLKQQQKALEKNYVPEAAKDYASVKSEIKDLEEEINSPEYVNQLAHFRELKGHTKETLNTSQKHREELLLNITRNRQLLESGKFTDKSSVTKYREDITHKYREYKKAESNGSSNSGKTAFILSVIACILCTAALFYMNSQQNVIIDYASGNQSYIIPPALIYADCIAVFLFFLLAVCIGLRIKRNRRIFHSLSEQLSAAFLTQLGNTSVCDEAFDAFSKRMTEFEKMSDSLTTLDDALKQQDEEIASLKKKDQSFDATIEQQQRLHWELEKKMEYLSQLKTKAEGLKSITEENRRIDEETESIALAIETITELSVSIRSSFGHYLNRASSVLISGITGGKYSSISIDEDLNIFLNTEEKLVPMDQVSSGTLDQLYLALRVASAELIQDGKHALPLILDDSFALYDDERLAHALSWLAKTCTTQLLIFTCHHREAQALDEASIPYQLIEIS